MESEENRDQPPPERTEGQHPVFICWVLTRGDHSREQRPQKSQGTNSQGITRLAPHWTPLYKEKTAPRAQFRVGWAEDGLQPESVFVMCDYLDN